ncbi:MAG: RNA polymerase sigma factor [Clostridia bacterium]|nr:RNA polymerase sigma factor [Clostridia bacterium]
MSDSMKERALMEAIERHKHRVFRVAVSCLKRRQDAEDALQEVFIKFYRFAPEFRDDEHEKAWILRVTVNTCISMLRSPWRRLFAPLPENVPSPGTESQWMIDLVRSLPAKYSIPLHLHYYEDYSVREIASILNLSEGTVKSRLSRARKRLGELIEKEETLDG